MNPKVIKINVKTAGELLKRLRMSTKSELFPQINVKGFFPNPHFSTRDLESDPEATVMTVYEHDGSDYTISIQDVEAVVEFQS